VGENPQAADVSGIHVNRRRRQALYFCGFACGLAGSFLTLGLSPKFGADGVSGKGFIAIAAVIFGGWTLKGTIGGSLLFGSFIAFGSVFSSIGHKANSQLLHALPFIVALGALLYFARRSRPPGALGRPFARGLT
jgi:simple sugar transport system permease protein